MKLRKNMKLRKHMKTRKHMKLRKHMKSRKQNKNIKLIIKDLGKKTKKYKRIQYGCKKLMSGGGPLFQPFTYVSRSIENGINNTYDTMYGYNGPEYTNY